MQKPELWRLVLACLHPNKVEASPTEWRHHISRSIVPEVKQEIIRFYGSSDELESQYPGLDYANPNHRLRLGSYPYHSQLFHVFDTLRLTDDEIYMLCKWHGTKRAKDDYERRHAVKIVDTTLDDVHPYAQPVLTVTFHQESLAPQAESIDILSNRFRFERNGTTDQGESIEDRNSEDHFDASEDESEDGNEVERSVGITLNQRLLANSEANVQAQIRGEGISTDPDWEQWVKEAAEREATHNPSASLSDPLAAILGGQLNPLTDLTRGLSAASTSDNQTDV